ncbi:MAG: glutamate formimidoyltransferase [Gemmatimonadetes bacterium]|nr:glutamate formimidoyltransferase [Gemmatimonadota bacterium]MYA13023.1 glutamate formimidoyltransferase [Gemmatimonadota bacterium]MYD14274.1 glutamate formimidoyltransferase [Gemmatimonadota bacterium]MYE68461.1 glutamate formimidoyltransferase [Gemmatimonadota bacterium]MYI64509.1 glutamate formimidoyltransferase [Gemmatimonadota bacterium]
MIPVLETVPNFSEGRDPGFVEAVRGAFERSGCDVLHTTMDPDHHRSVVTVIGPPGAVEDGAVAAARLALERIDLRKHSGVHPRVGALDVLPFVPLQGQGMDDAVRSARRVGARIAALGLPVYFYAQASKPPGRTLASVRRGGFEALRERRGHGGAADLPGRDAGASPIHRFAHPSAGAVCVGARAVLLAWNVDVEGLSREAARGIAAGIRETAGGFRGLRALAFRLRGQGRTQISMNLEDPSATDPVEVFTRIEREASRLGGTVAGTEVVGLAPDALASPAAVRAMRIRDWSDERLLRRRVDAWIAAAGG